MPTWPISDARDHLADLGNRVAPRGKRLFALVPIEDLERLEQLEDAADPEALRPAPTTPAASGSATTGSSPA